MDTNNGLDGRQPEQSRNGPPENNQNSGSKSVNNPTILFEINEDGKLSARVSWPEFQDNFHKQKVTQLILQLMWIINTGEAKAYIDHAISAYGMLTNQEEVSKYLLDIQMKMYAVKESLSRQNNEEAENNRPLVHPMEAFHINHGKH